MTGRAGRSTAGLAIGVLVCAAMAAGVVAVLRTQRDGAKGPGLGEEFNYDLKALGRVDPRLILYEEPSPPIAVGLAEPRGIATGPEDRVYIVGDRAVGVLNSEGQQTGRFELAGAPAAVDVDAGGLMYVAMTDHVEVYDGRGRKLAAWPAAGGQPVFTSIAAAENDVFVADAGNKVVLRYDKTGKLISEIGRNEPRRNIEGFFIPSPCFDVAMGADGLLRAVNPGRRRIEAYTREGDLEFWWGQSSTAIEGFAGCCNPAALALLPAGGGFVTCEKGLTRVKVYDAEGKFAGVVAAPEQFARHDALAETRDLYSARALDVAVDAQGRVLVLDPLTAEVRVFVRRAAAGAGKAE